MATAVQTIATIAEGGDLAYVEFEDGFRMVVLLTECCKAASKYVDNGHGSEVHVCKACYRSVAGIYGWGATASEFTHQEPGVIAKFLFAGDVRSAAKAQKRVAKFEMEAGR